MSQSRLEKYLVLFLGVHDTVYQKSRGWIGHRLPGFAPALLLHTVGAKTGQPRTTSLSYANDGNNYLVVASRGGSPKAPGWYFNLKKQPQVEINVGPRRFGVTARIVGPDDRTTRGCGTSSTTTTAACTGSIRSAPAGRSRSSS